MYYVKIDDACQACVGVFVNTTTGEIIPARCKKWSCKTCGPRRARRFIARVSRAPHYSYFVTLTAPRDFPEYLASAHVRRVNASWRSWLQWLKREVGVRDVSWVLERGTRTGHLHRHALISTRKSFSYSRARAALVRSGHGAVCDFKPIRLSQSGRAARYMGKYMAKGEPEKFTFPRYARRSQTTVPDLKSACQDVYLFEGRPDSPWRRRAEPKSPLINEPQYPPSEYIGGQRSLALNQKDKVRHGP